MAESKRASYLKGLKENAENKTETTLTDNVIKELNNFSGNSSEVSEQVLKAIGAALGVDVNESQKEIKKIGRPKAPIEKVPVTVYIEKTFMEDFETVCRAKGKSKSQYLAILLKKDLETKADRIAEWKRDQEED